MVAAHYYGTPHELGLNPLLSLPTDDTDQLLQTYKDAILTLSTAVSATLPPVHAPLEVAEAFDEGKGGELELMEFQVNLGGNRQINTAYGTIGRGTTVIPVVAGQRAAVHCGTGRLIAKVACPLESRQAEDRFIRIVRRKINDHDHARQFLKHIVDLKCSFSCDMHDTRIGLPRAAMGRVSADMRRCFRVLVMPEYFPLECINGPGELQQIFINVVTGKYSSCIFGISLAKVHNRTSLGLGDVAHLA